MNKKGQTGIGVVSTLVLIVGIAIGLPILFGGFAIVIKMIQLMFFTNVVGVPIWAIFLIIPAAIVIIKKMGRK